MDSRRYLLLGQIRPDFFQLLFAHGDFLWKFEHSQLNTLAVSIFHFDRGAFFLCSDGWARLGWVPAWSQGTL